jgi:hypothetical protein
MDHGRGNDAEDRRRRKRASLRQEKEGTQNFSAVRHGGSGAGWARKHDAHTATELIEFKRTDNRRVIRIDLKEVQALEARAALEGRQPVVGIEMGTGDRFVLLREDDYLALRDRMA